MRKRTITVFVLGLTIGLLCTLIFVSAQTPTTPPTINFQGRLTDISGISLNGQYNLTFRIYDASTAGNLVWGPEQQINVDIVDGVFNVTLGSINAFDATVFNEPDRWLSIEVNSDGEMAQRIKFSSAPYALQTQSTALIKGNKVQTDSTTETELDSVTLNAGDLGTNSYIKIHLHFTSGNAGTQPWAKLRLTGDLSADYAFEIGKQTEGGSAWEAWYEFTLMNNGTGVLLQHNGWRRGTTASQSVIVERRGITTLGVRSSGEAFNQQLTISLRGWKNPGNGTYIFRWYIEKSGK